ncbi:energy transducer TonB [Actinobacillus succinogenes]|uniref:Protein TonB n=1 Tax=Actinobacillus succinogenes (strain ATCC 55618 / DSM 22257 / CCUG 43843 / 130Z) TaxID=339671 RepID=A6VQV9_ACTSZ|nr:energy transducer TonB [Actinobacillus succinogenes]ABR75356.1 TonB family protein [Actinobacillus succinogenes 130Z]PHI40255.1 energy transducer TonB [Actinobacillus succinogenes]
MKGNSWLGFIGSAIFHAGLAVALFTAFKDEESVNGQSAEEISTNISMEMLMATTVESIPSQPEPEPVKQAEPEPEKKEMVADPTLKPKPEKPKEKPKEKAKEKPKEKPPEKKQKPVKKTVNETARAAPNPQPNAVVADRVRMGNANVNSKATATSANANSNNANLTGSGASSSEVAEYKSRIRREIERHKKYSQRARMMRKQGVVVVAFSIGNNGVISGAHIVKSSGTEDLDNSALAAVNAAKSVGPKPAGMSNAISVPISFKIQ